MKIIKRVIIFLSILVLVPPIVLVLTLTLFEYRPKDVETLSVIDNQEGLVKLDESIRLMTFNIGYAGLGKDEDFVLDGGTKGRPDSLSVVEAYLSGVKDLLDAHPIDIYLLQEVDRRARRSYHLNQMEIIHEHLGLNYSSQYAYNFKVPFVPFPLSLTDHIGYVESGIQTLMPYGIQKSERHQFPGAFSWPLRTANLKRSMLATYLDIENSDKQLIIVNLHMSAYDADGELRNQEMAYLKSFMESEYLKGNYVIIGGDFNQTFPEAVGIYTVDSDLYQAFPIENDFLPNGFTFQVDLTSPTCRLLNQPYRPNTAGTFYYIIDGFIVSNNITIEAFEGLSNVPGAVTIDDNFRYSDHNPVVIQVKLTSS